MAEYYIIAAGGTGAMCARSFIYMAAAGCAQENATYNILLMDKDKESDAMTACENLLMDYQAMRSQLGTGTGNGTFPKIVLHKWNFTAEIVDEYMKQTGEQAINLQNLTLNKLLNPRNEDEVATLLSTMYSTEELNTDLNKGFYGHPNIGAPVFDYVRERFLARTNINAKGENVVNTFMQSLHNSLSNGTAHVYLMGSLFGGTGATVIPNVALALRSMCDPLLPSNNYGKTRLILGGSVVMPYFKLPSCPADSYEALQKVSPVDAKFAEQTKEALAYYHEGGLLSNMMNLLLVGSSKLDVTSEAFARGGSQHQHFHVVPMLAAVGANRFFANKLGDMASGITLNSATPKGELLLWKVTPNDPANAGTYQTLMPDELDLEEEYKKMTAFLRFSVVVAYYMRLKFSKTPQDLMRDVEILSTVRQMKRDGRALDPRNLSQTDINVCYKEPVAKAGAICRGFINFFYDVALSGYDWSKYRNYVRSTRDYVTVEEKKYYNYELGAVSENAMNYFTERWADFANLEALKRLLEADTPSEIIDGWTLNDILSFRVKDEMDRPPYLEVRFPNNIATVYERHTLKPLGAEKNIFGKIRNENLPFSEIYAQLYKQCE